MFGRLLCSKVSIIYFRSLYKAIVLNILLTDTVVARSQNQSKALFSVLFD